MTGFGISDHAEGESAALKLMQVPAAERLSQGWLRLLGQISLADKWICLGG
jgi:hypothetical protein